MPGEIYVYNYRVDNDKHTVLTVYTFGRVVLNDKNFDDCETFLCFT